MKYLGIDYGTKRVGIAVSDDDGSFAFPRTIVPTIDALAEITTIVTEEKVQHIIIGESVASNGEVNDVQAAVKKFADMLQSKTGIPVHFEREDFSSVEAHRYQTTAGSRDDSAAAIILQRFLDKKGK